MNSFMKHDFCIDKILLATSVRGEEGAPVHRDRSSHGLAFYVGGESTFSFGEKRLRVKKNDLIYLPKHSHYTVESHGHEEGIRCFAINFDDPSLPEIGPFTVRVKNATGILEFFSQSEKIWKGKKLGYAMECKANLYRILCLLQREFEAGYLNTGISRILEPAMSYIHRRYTEEELEIRELARLCRVSETYFRTVFKKTYGCSPKQYIHHLKLSRAKELLLSRMYPVCQAGRLSGFRDEAYFSREFKKATGICPSDYTKETTGNP